MKLLDDIRKILHKEEPDPWNQPEKPKITDEEIEKAIEEMNKPKPSKKAIIILGVWWLINFGIIFVMILGVYVGAVNLYFLSFFAVNIILISHHILILGKVNRK